MIGPEWILTAAHCLVHDSQPLSEVNVVYGLTNHADIVSLPDEDIAKHSTWADSYIIHPQYGDDATLDNDIALLHLQIPVDLTTRSSHTALRKRLVRPTR